MGRRQLEIIHKVNAYTWAGRRAECALTSEFLPSVQSWDGVTCPDCLALASHCSPMGTNARGVAQCSEGHGDYPDACEEARA